MDSNALIEANIDNLTELWKEMGVQSHSPWTGTGLHASASWPHRHWLDKGIDSTQLPALDNAIANLPQTAVVPVWPEAAANTAYLEQRLLHHGFRLTFEQTAMYLAPAGHRSAAPRSTPLQKVSLPHGIAAWVAVASEAFGYAIDSAVIRKLALLPHVQLLQINLEGNVAATAMLYNAGGVVGVHQLGVAKEHQGKGLATALMQGIINQRRTWHERYIVLQASELARSLYQRLGFKPQFMIRNYQRAD